MGNVDLSVEFAGVKMRNPVGIGSVAIPLVKREYLTSEIHAETLLKHINEGAGYVCLPPSNHVPKEMLADLRKKAKPYNFSEIKRTFKFMKMETKGFGLSGMYYGSVSSNPPEVMAKYFEQSIAKLIEILLKNRPKGVPIIASTAGIGAFPETFVEDAKVLEQAGVDLLEINVGCGLPAALAGSLDYLSEGCSPLRFGGVLIGDQIDIVENITNKVVQAVHIPVGVKLSPETGFPRIVELAKKIKEAGAKFINCSNNAVVIAPPDIYNGGKSPWPFMEENFFCAGCGNWLRQIVFKQVTAITKFVPGIDVMCTGGLVTPENIIEALMLGAKATQFVTAMMFEGRNTIKKYIRFLEKYMQEQGYASVSDFTGLGLKYIKPADEVVDWKTGKIYAEIDTDKCNGCRRCVNQICLATYIEDNVAKVDATKCIGCGMCVALCPQGAPVLRERS
jgi:dihydropyrimidine dehydrogenase (NAD+) subunit PreA